MKTTRQEAAGVYSSPTDISSASESHDNDDNNNDKSFYSSNRSTIICLCLCLGILVSSLSGAYIPSSFSHKVFFLESHHHSRRHDSRTSRFHHLSRSSTSPTVGSTTPSVEELKSYVHYAYAAFCPNETLHNWTCQWCLLDNNQEFHITSILFNERTKTRGFVGYDPSRNITVASFRGSHGNAVNWWLDLEPGTTKDFHNVTIRKGWVLAYEALRDQLMQAIQQIRLDCPSCSTTFVATGHSLGAAISGLAALDVKLSIPWMETVKMRNFGMPRVGYQDFVQLFHDNVESSYRVVHYRDVVPHYPLKVRHAFPYHHVGTELWEPQEFFDGTLQLCDGSGEDKRCSNSLPIWHWDPADHMQYMGIQNNNCE